MTLGKYKKRNLKSFWTTSFAPLNLYRDNTLIVKYLNQDIGTVSGILVNHEINTFIVTFNEI